MSQPLPAHNYRQLRADKIVETCALLAARVGERFAGSGLQRVATEVVVIAREAQVRAEHIHRPFVPLRIGIGLLVLCMVGLCLAVIPQLRPSSELLEMEHFAQTAGGLIQTLVYVGLAILFLVTVEVRVKRTRALSAMRELRAIAHIVDMHQLTKDPGRVLRPQDADTASSPARSMTKFELGRYLDYCSELLSVLSKIGAIYVQEFPDAVALEAADDLASLTNGLARNIWQKIMILDLTAAAIAPGEVRSSGQAVAADSGTELAAD